MIGSPDAGATIRVVTWEATTPILDWGKYLGKEALDKGIAVRVSSWRRAAPDTFPFMAKTGANYLNA